MSVHQKLIQADKIIIYIYINIFFLFFFPAMVVLFLFSKMAIFKAATFFFFLAFFQKLFAFGGVLLTYMMKNQAAAPMAQPISIYGPPEYNTLGYSYGPPDHEPVLNEGSSIPDLTGAFNWFSGKQRILQ